MRQEQKTNAEVYGNLSLTIAEKQVDCSVVGIERNPTILSLAE